MGAYAKPEIERRYLVRTHGFESDQAPREIDDLYLEGLRLRLRRVQSAGTVVFKLTQKVRPRPADPHRVSITNMYLEAQEYERLRRLPGRRLAKTRLLVPVEQLVWSVDTFHGHLEGLILAEIELPDVASVPATPPWLGSEVTHDDKFSGGRLARATASEVAVLLAQQ